MATGKTILVIDDDPFMLTLVKAHLEGAGFRVEVARDGRDGLDKATRMKPDAIVLDFAMPSVGGGDVLTAIRANPDTFRLPVLFLTAWASARDEKLARDLGASWLEKPVQSEQLIAAVRRLAA